MDSQEKISADVREGSTPVPTKTTDPEVPTEIPAPTDSEHKSPERAKGNKKVKQDKRAAGKRSKSKRSKSKRQASADGSSPDSSGDDSDDSTSDSDSEPAALESGSVHRGSKKRAAKKRPVTQSSKKHVGQKSHKKAVKARQSHVSDSDSDSDSGSDSASDSDESVDPVESRKDKSQRVHQQQQELAKQLQLMQLQQQLQAGNGYQYPAARQVAPPGLPASSPTIYDPQAYSIPPSRARGGQYTGGRQLALGGLDPNLLLDGNQQQQRDRKKQKASKLDYKRVDQVWDNTLHNFKLQDTAQHTVNAQYEEFLFHVRRTFAWDGKFKSTVVDIKSKLLRESLQEVMGNIKGVSLVEETPSLDPNMLFLYSDDLRKHMRSLKKAKPTTRNKHDRKKEKQRIETKRQHLKVLLKYVDKDYAEVRKSLYPMIENGLITFDLLWALWKPNTLAFTTTYGSEDEPRVFKVEMAEKLNRFLKGDFYSIEGKYFEYDGKQFGYGSMSSELNDFRGARKITSLPCYPLQYHKNEASLRTELIERGKTFVALGGVRYKSHKGMAYHKKKKGVVVKVNINGRIMVDAQIHRRINPNYPISHVRPKDQDMISDDDDSDDDGCFGCESNHIDEVDRAPEEEGQKVKFVIKAIKDGGGNVQMVQVPPMDDEEANKEQLDQVPSRDAAARDDGSQETDDEDPPVFTDEEYLIASPVVLGFAFAEKLWLEFTVSGVRDIEWNDNAYESLVLEHKTKAIVKALVESHKYHAAESIDDVIVGKGKGLVAVLHGPPGTGKTLTAEGISELLKCPLYMASAGELGTDSRFLESELQKILDVCHAWGAILLLDEADVFLEKRNMHDIHRNALVSIFLRQLEYFQGILFLTTNRVETFDDAFQSRIHIALRYDNLDQKAKKAIFKIFIERVRVLEKADTMPFTEENYTDLARHELNGRQIKNTVRTAQALAVNKREPLSMGHIRQVLEVQMSFDRDLKGGTGYQEAMRSYF